MSSDKVKLNTIDDVRKYMGLGDSLLVRNLEGRIPRHWVDNYDFGKPERIEITEDLFESCIDSEYFDVAEIPSKREE